MNKLKNLIAVFAVLIGITSAFAFKAPKAALAGTIYAVNPTSSPAFPSSGSNVTITFSSLGTPAPNGCDLAPRVCKVITTEQSEVTENPDGTLTITHANLLSGLYQ